MQPQRPAATVRLGDVLAVGGSLFVFIFSFMPFIAIRIPGLFGGAGLEDWQNAWAAETFMAPLTWFVVLAGLLLILGVTVRYLGGRDPDLLGFRLTQLEVGLGLFMLLVLFGMLTSEKHIIFGAAARVQGEAGATLKVGWGAILMLIGALVAAVGAVLTHLSVGPTIFPRPLTPTTTPPAEAPTTAGWPTAAPTTAGWPATPPPATDPYAPPPASDPYAPPAHPAAAPPQTAPPAAAPPQPGPPDERG